MQTQIKEKCSPSTSKSTDNNSFVNDILNPDNYHQAVDIFFKYFQVPKRSPSLDYLSEILLCYSHLPYENLSKIIKHKNQMEWTDKIRLPEEVMDDHMHFRFGGTCFSLTFTLETILSLAGFVCYPIMADMKWRPNSHCALIVIWKGDKYLIDPGYLLNQPMRLNGAKPRVLHSEISGVEVIYRPSEDYYHLYTFNKDQTKWRYRFRDIIVSRQEYFALWLDSYHWNSMHGLLLTKTKKGCMVYVHKTFMRETTFKSKKNINIKHDYHQAIHDTFGIDKIKVEEALAALDVNMQRERELGLWVPKKNAKAPSIDGIIDT
ncbi:arylamine N-acetyltransferase [bacterium]|nr:arylamine N-acetyltransferase [bacterium]